ncbi:MAG: helix-turn-helix domain-containing protein [Blautia sp.]|nr:helix-turn-helix domain-containing protein [Blautia sp.]
MAYLSTILKRIAQTFRIDIYETPIEKTVIDGVCFLTSKDKRTREYDPKLLYLGRYEEYFDIYDQRFMLLTASPSQILPGQQIAILQDLDLIALYNTIAEEILRYHRIQQKTEELFHSLHSGYGIEGILNIAYHHLQNPIALCDTSFTILCSCPRITTDTVDLEAKSGRVFVREKQLEDMRDTQTIEKIYQSPYPFVVKLTYNPNDQIYAPVRIRQSVVGFLNILLENGSVTEEDLEFVYNVSRMISIEMQKDNTYNSKAGLKYEYFLAELFDGNYDRQEYVRHQLVQLGFRPAPYYFVLICQFSKELEYRPAAKYYFDQILAILPGSMVTMYHGKITILLSGQSQTPFNESSLDKLETFLKMNQMILGISYAFSDLFLAPHYYTRTVSMLDMYKKTGYTQRFVFYEENFLKNLFHMCPNDNLIADIHPHIVSMHQYDIDNHTEYIHTLEVYLANNRNAVATAAALHIHKSTFFYRLNKMNELFRTDTTNGKLLFSYNYSLHLIRYLNNVKKS